MRTSTPLTITSTGTSTLREIRPACRNTDIELAMTKNAPKTNVALSKPPITNVITPTINNPSDQIQSMFGAISNAVSSQPLPTVISKIGNNNDNLLGFMESFLSRHNRIKVTIHMTIVQLQIYKKSSCAIQPGIRHSSVSLL